MGRSELDAVIQQVYPYLVKQILIRNNINRTFVEWNLNIFLRPLSSTIELFPSVVCPKDNYEG